MPTPASPPSTQPGRLYLLVLAGVGTGAILGLLAPNLAAGLKPVADGFIALIKMIISPVIFCTVVLGIGGMKDMRKLGRVGLKALFYFEVISTLALVIGLITANTLKPGSGFHIDPRSLETSGIAEFTRKAGELSFKDYVLHLIPKTFIDAFTANGDLLQVLLLAILSGVALASLGPAGQPVHDLLEAINRLLFRIVNLIMKAAPLGAGAAMAFTLGKFGVGALKSLFAIMGVFYLTCGLFILVILGGIARLTGFSLFRFLAYIRDELLTVLGTSSSESALVPLMHKLETLGCPRSIVGVVVPAGYSFNLDGTNIYMTLATLFIAQALDIDLSLRQQLTILGVSLLTSKGASGVTGAGFVTLAATLAVVPDIPVAGMALLLGIDRFMSEARAVTNHIGNGVATLVIARWENELDLDHLRRELQRPAGP